MSFLDGKTGMDDFPGSPALAGSSEPPSGFAASIELELFSDMINAWGTFELAWVSAWEFGKIYVGQPVVLIRQNLLQHPNSG